MQTFLRTVAQGRRLRGDRRRRRVLPRVRRDGGRASASVRIAVEQLLADPTTAFVLVTSPRRDALDEARVLRRAARRPRPGGRRADREPRASRRSATSRPTGCARVPPSCARTRSPTRRSRAARGAATTTSPTSARSRCANASTSTGLRDELGAAIDRVRAVPRPRRLRLRRAPRDRAGSSSANRDGARASVTR